MKYNRRDFLKISGMGLAAGLVSNPLMAGLYGKTPSGIPPNIIFIITDDQHRADFNYLPEGQDEHGHGINLTPTMDKLSSEGIIFRNQYVSSSVCTPSRYSCLTGQYARRARNSRFVDQFDKSPILSVGWNTRILQDTKTLAGHLQRNGYYTGMVGKNHVIEVGDLHKIPKDADPYDPEINRRFKLNREIEINAIKRCGFDYAASIYHANLPGITCEPLQHHNMDWIVQGALDFIDQKSGKPFFLYMGTTLNHGPDKPGTKYKADPRITPYGMLDKAPEVMPKRDTIPERLNKAGITTERAADNLWLDDGLDAIVSSLDEKGLLDDTVIFYFNDHGVESGKGSLYQGGILSQSWIWSKELFKGGRISETQVSNIDFAPTILDIADAKYKPEWFDGESMISVLEGDKQEIHQSLFFEIGYSRAVIKGDWKYMAIRYPSYITDPEALIRRKKTEDRKRSNRNKKIVSDGTQLSHMGTPGGRGSEQPAINHYPNYYDQDQLYNLKLDPDEFHNLIDNPEYKSKLKEMQDLLSSYIRNLPGEFGEF